MLLAHGYCDFVPQASETVRNVPDDFPFQPRLARWNGTSTEAWVPPPTADETRLAAIDTNINSTAVGTTSPQTIAELKAMDFPAYSAWFDANFDTAAKVIGFVKRLGIIVIRRVL